MGIRALSEMTRAPEYILYMSLCRPAVKLTFTFLNSLLQFKSTTFDISSSKLKMTSPAKLSFIEKLDFVRVIIIAGM